MKRQMMWIAVLTAGAGVGLWARNEPFEKLISQIVAQLEQQAESDQRLIAQTNALRDSLHAADERLAKNALPIARESVLRRESMMAANEMIANPQRTKLIYAAFLRSTLQGEDAVLDEAVNGPGAAKLTTTRLAAQTKARQAVLKDLRRDVESLRQFPTKKERLQFVVDHVETIAKAVQQRTAAGVTQP